jgi:hypothetical protein
LNATTLPRIVPDAEVRDFLQRHRAESAFDKVCTITRECYPHLLQWRCRLRDDPDVANRDWCVIEVTVPLIENVDQRAVRWHEFHHRLVAEVPSELVPLFALSEKYQQP